MQIDHDDLAALFDQELATQDGDIRQAAALAAVRRLPIGNGLTVDQFFGQVQTSPALWGAISQLSITDLAGALSRAHGAAPAPTARRTRVDADAKAALKVAVLRVIAAHPQGLSRSECAAVLLSQGLAPTSIKPADLPEKIRDPLKTLVAEGRLGTTGKLKTMRYRLGTGSSAPAPTADHIEQPA